MYHNRSDGFRSVHADHEDFGLASDHSSLKSLFFYTFIIFAVYFLSLVRYFYTMQSASLM